MPPLQIRHFQQIDQVFDFPAGVGFRDGGYHELLEAENCQPDLGEFVDDFFFGKVCHGWRVSNLIIP